MSVLVIFFYFYFSEMMLSVKQLLYNLYSDVVLSDFKYSDNTLLFFFWSRKITTYVSLCSPLEWAFSHQFKSQYCISRLSRCASVFICMNVSIIQMGHRRENRLRQQRKKTAYIQLIPSWIIFSMLFFFGYWSYLENDWAE